MAITISGENNNDKILATDGVIDSLSGFNIVGVITATTFTGDLTGDVTGNLTGNVTGNINNSTLLLQTGGNERVRIDSNGKVGVGVNPSAYPGKFVVSGDALICDRDIHSRVASSVANSDRGFKQDTDGVEKLHLYADNSSNIILEGSGGSERLRITSDGNITFGIQNTVTAVTSSPIKYISGGRDYWNGTKGDYRALRLRVYDNGGNIDDQYGIGVSNGQLEIQSQGSIGFYASGAGSSTGRRVHAMTIDTGQKLLLGLTSARTNFFNAAATHVPRFQIESTNNDIGRAAIGLVYGKTNDSGPYITLAKHRSNTLGDNTVVQQNDETGIISFQGSDGSEFIESARIQAFIDGTPGSNDMPGRLVFRTTPDGSAAAVERVRITSTGKVNIGDTQMSSNLLNIEDGTAAAIDLASHGTGGDTAYIGVKKSAGGGLTFGISNRDIIFKTGASYSSGTTFDSGTERVRITSDGSVGFGLGSSYAPETPIDVVANWANTRSDVTTVSTYHRKLPLDERGDITIVARHSASKDGAVGYVGPIIDFRSTNSSNEEWTVAQLVGGTDPLGGSGYQGGLSIFTSNGGNNVNSFSGRRNQGDAPTLSAVIAPYRITTFNSSSSQSSSAIHITKNLAANNVQSDMIHFDVGGGGRGKIVSASSGSGNPSFSTYSDRRLKTNFRDYTGGYDRIKAIPVKLYDEVLNDQTKSVFGDNVKTDVIGWIADEVQSVFPDAVIGTKDEVDSDGKPVYQSLTEGTFLPDAIQAIQKLIEKVETLEAEVAALKG